MANNPNAHWIHCNKCFRLKQPDDHESFFFTQCLHVFCKSCLGPTCFVCRRAVKIMKIDSSMPPSIKVMFEDLRGYLNRIPKIMKFQWSQQSHILQSKQENAMHLKDTYRKRQRMYKAECLLEEDSKREQYKVMKMEQYIAKAHSYRQNKLHEGQHSSKRSGSELRYAMYNRARMRHQEEERLQQQQNQRRLQQQQYEKSFESEQRSTVSRPRIPPSENKNTTRDTGFSSRATNSFFKFF